MKYKREIYEVMKDLGMCPNNLGYKYSCHIINELLEESPDSHSAMSLYQSAAKEFDTPYTAVERAIRHAVEVVCANTSTEILRKYFGNCLSAKSGKVYNYTFLTCIAEYIRVYVL